MGRKSFPLRESEELTRPERRHLAAAYATGVGRPERDITWHSKGRVIWPSGQCANEFVSAERVLEMESGIKRRVGSLKERRNHISVRALGDKPYACAEMAPGFFKQEGGLIAGACIQDRRRTKIKKTVETKVAKPTYVEKKKAEAERIARAEVYELTNATGENGECLSWEERMNLYSSSPKVCEQ